jgi:hypothetical protein
MTDPTLLDVLQATLLPRGFAATNAHGRFVRTVGVMRQVVGLRNGHDGDGSAVYFLLEEGPAGSDGSYELSPVAPFKNTWWWPSHLASHDAATLVVSLENQALAWFEAWEQGFDPAAGAAGLLAQLEPLQDALPAFRQRGDTWWRVRGEVIDLVDVERVAGGVFTFVYLAHWHACLGEGFDAQAPEAVSRIASTTIGEGRLDGVPNATLFHLGADAQDGFAVPSPALVSTALRSCEAVLTRDHVLAKVRPEYRHLLPS